MRGCAIRGRVSRKQGRDCIERIGMYLRISNQRFFFYLKISWETVVEGARGDRPSLREKFFDFFPTKMNEN
jgi:hypothetical protein